MPNTDTTTIAERLRAIVDEPHARVTVALEPGCWMGDTIDDDIAHHESALPVDAGDVTVTGLASGIGWLHGPGAYVHVGDACYAPAHDENEDEFESLLASLATLDA